MADAQPQNRTAATGTLAPKAIQRPRRWDVPFGPDMTDTDVEYLLSVRPFVRMDQAMFPPSAPLRDILRYDSRILRLRNGDIIVRQGDYGNSAFFVLSGTVRIVTQPPLPESVLGRRRPDRKGFWSSLAQLWSAPSYAEVRDVDQYQRDKQVGARGDDRRMFLQDVPGILKRHETTKIFAGQVEEGDVFGELAAVARTPRTATAFADGQVQLLEIRWQGLRDIMRRDAAMKDHIDHLYRERVLRRAITATSIFRHLDGPEHEEAMRQVESDTALESFGSFDWHGSFRRLADAGAGERLEHEPIIAQEGQWPDGVLIIRNGFARLTRRLGNGHQTVNYLGKGRSYGFEECYYNWSQKNERVPLQYSLRAVGYADVLRVPLSVLEKYVFPGLPASLRPAPVRAQATPGPSRALRGSSSGIGTDLLEFLVERRLMNGTAAMVIDLDRCTRCDDCVRACASTHDNNPRFVRHGPRHGRFMVANACMHCADPVCMIECPTGAIHRDLGGGQVVINDATCIGCTSCAVNCPYDNIRMVEIRDANGRFIVAEETHQPIVKATKCDLCVDQLGGPACQRACPHDALIRLDLSDENAVARWVGR